MNRDQFNESMKRVLAFTQNPKSPGEIQHLQNYMNGLYEAIGSMDAFLFEKVTVEICKNMSRGQRPMPGQFWAVYHRLKDEQQAGKPITVCPSCKNTIWNMVRMMEQKTGLEMDFAEPCPECQIKHPFKDAPPREGWIRVERKGLTHEQDMIQMAKKMGPRGARFVLDLIEKMGPKTKFSDDVILELVLRAGDTPKQENKVAEDVLDSLIIKEPAREAAPMAAVGSPVPEKVVVNGETYEVEE